MPDFTMAHTAKSCTCNSTHTLRYAPGAMTSILDDVYASSKPPSETALAPPPRSGSPLDPVHRTCSWSCSVRAKNVSAVCTHQSDFKLPIGMCA